MLNPKICDIFKTTSRRAKRIKNGPSLVLGTAYTLYTVHFVHDSLSSVYSYSVHFAKFPNGARLLKIATTLTAYLHLSNFSHTLWEVCNPDRGAEYSFLVACQI